MIEAQDLIGEDWMREGNHPLNDDFEVLEDPLFKTKLEDATKYFLESGTILQQAEARQQAARDIVKHAGFQDYQGKAFQLGHNKPTQKVREFVELHGWDRSEDNVARREAKRDLDDAILEHLDGLVEAHPSEFWRQDEFMINRNEYRIQQLLDTADRNNNYGLGFEALGVPPALLEHTTWGPELEQSKQSAIKALSNRLNRDNAPWEFGDRSPEMTAAYLDMFRLRLTADQRNAMQAVIEEEFAPQVEVEENDNDDHYLNGYQPPIAEEAKPVGLTEEQRRLIGLIAFN